MMTPEHANALLAQQQQQAFALQNQGQYGTVPAPGPSMYPAQFNYGRTSHSITGRMPGVPGMIGNAIPGALSGIGMAAGVGSMLGVGGAGMAGLALLDPFAAAMAGGAAGLGAGGLGMAALGGLGAGALALGGIGTATYASHRAAGGANQQANLGHQLSGMGFANSMSESGRGFDFHGLHSIGEMMREFDAADPFTTMRDLSQLMEKFNQQGLSQGITDAKDFAKKFTEYADAVRDIAMTMGTTLQDAAPMFGQMRQTGFYTAQDVMGNTRHMQTARGMGMDEGQFLSMQQGASQTTRQMQMTGKSGALASSRLAEQMLMGAAGAGSGGLGLYSDEYLMDITGAEDLSSATANLSQQFTGSLANFLRSSAGGRDLMSSVGEQKNGEYTGGVNADALAGVASGGVGFRDLTKSGVLGTKRGATSFLGQEHNIASGILESDQGADAIYALLEEEAKKLMGDASDENVMVLAQRVLKMDMLNAELYVKTMKRRSELKSATSDALRRETTAAGYQMEITRNRSLDGKWQQVKGGFKDFFSPVEQMGANMQTAWEQTGQDISDSFWGNERYAGVNVSSRADFSRGIVTGQYGDLGLGARDPRSYSSGSAFGAVRRAGGDADSAALAAMRGELTPEMIAPGATDAAFRGSLSAGKKARAEELLLDIRVAEAMGDEDKVNEAKGRFQRLAVTLSPDEELQPGYGYDGNKIGGVTRVRTTPTQEGARTQAASWLAAELGSQGLASQFALKGGGGESTTFKSMKESREGLESALQGSGIDSALQSDLVAGKAGSGVKTLGFMKDQGLDRTAIREAMREHPGMGPAEALRAKYGDAAQHLDEDDVLSALKISEQTEGGVRDERTQLGKLGSVPGMVGISVVGGWMGADLGTMRSVDAQGQFDLVMDAAVARDREALWLNQQDSVAAEVGMMGRGVRRALGDGTLKTLSTTMDGDDYRTALGSVYDRIARGDLDGIKGGAGLQSIVDQNLKAQSPDELMELYGIGSLEELEAWGGNKDGTITAEELKKIQRNLGMDQINQKLSASGGSGGLAMSGMSFEEQTLYNMGLTAEKVSKMAETVDALYNAADQQGLIAAYVAAKGE